ncbi:small secreted hydrophilic protein [Streptomyces sp. NPDC047117]|uniref:small secreted hydrophilic protein n=1 Tax=Streptomyces sp. NPDC047117 TaxID=3155379 RepID=UPI0033DE0D81
MAFSQRMAALAAVVAIPLGIAATSYALTDSPESPKVPPKVELDSGSPSAGPTRPGPAPSDEVVPRPPVSDDSSGNASDGPSGDASDDGADDSSDDGDDHGAGDRDDG